MSRNNDGNRPNSGAQDLPANLAAELSQFQLPPSRASLIGGVASNIFTASSSAAQSESVDSSPAPTLSSTPSQMMSITSSPEPLSPPVTKDKSK